MADIVEIVAPVPGLVAAVAVAAGGAVAAGDPVVTLQAMKMEIEVPSEQGALGSRGIGEPPIVPGLAAVANAIADATGVRLTAAPFTPEAMLEALKARAPAPARI